MAPAVNVVYALALALIVGGSAVLSAVVAPSVFGALPSRTQAAALFGRILTLFGAVEVTAAILVCAAGVYGATEYPGPAATLKLVLGGVLLAASILHHLWIFPVGRRMADEIGNFDAAPQTEAQQAQRRRFRRVHRVSMLLAMLVLLLGAALIVIEATRQSGGGRPF
jgi:uncharacterized membrane protein